MTKKIVFLVGALVAFMVPGASGMTARPMSVYDAVSMERIQGWAFDEPTGAGVATFSPSGRRFVVVVWHGDIGKDVNVFQVLRFDRDARGAWSKPISVLSIDYDPNRIPGDRVDQYAIPIAEIRFLSDNTTITFIGTFDGHVRQVYSFNTITKSLRQLTHETRDVIEYGVTRSGELTLLVTASVPTTQDEAVYERWAHQGVSLIQEPSWRPLFDQSFFLQQVSRFTFPGQQWWERTPPFRNYVFLLPRRHTISLTCNVPNSFSEPEESALSPSGERLVVLESRLIQAPKKANLRPGYFSRVYVGLTACLRLVDLTSGNVRTITSIPLNTVSFDTPDIVWSPDSRSFVFGPLGAGAQRAAAFKNYSEISASTTRSIGSFAVPRGWTVRGFSNASMLVLTRRAAVYAPDVHRIALIKKIRGKWAPLREINQQATFSFDQYYNTTVFSHYVVGVRDNLSTPPEIALYDGDTRQMHILTNLNPSLEHRAVGQVSRIFWPGPAGAHDHFGFLIKPVGYVNGKRYPLVFLLKDFSYDPSNSSYIIDGQEQLGGFAAQVLANDGFVVLLSPSPLSLARDFETPSELADILAHVQSGIAYLDHLGLIDPARVGLSGWSRAGFYTEYIIAHSKLRLLAASDVDPMAYRAAMLGENVTSPQNMLPDNQVDLHLRDIHTPLMSEVHGLYSVLAHAQLIGDLQALHKPVDFYFYPDAPHNLKSPRQRYFSLTRNVDWFRFWLQGYEDPDPAKAAQYRRWEQLKKLQAAEAPRP